MAILGFYESLFGVLKASLKNVLGSALLSSNELVTVLTEVQHVVNNRPLKNVGDGNDMSPLMPNSLLEERHSADVEDDAIGSSIDHDQANVKICC